MGNAMAAAAPLSTNPPMDLPKPVKEGIPASAPSEPTKDSTVVTEPSSERLEYPGLVEELHKKCKDVFPMNFEGVKIVLNKGISNHFQISHTINMSSITPSGYRFGSTYVGNQFPHMDPYPILLGDIDTSGNLNANIIHQLSDRIRGKMATQVIRNKFTAVQLTTDYKGDTHSFSATIGNPDIMDGSGIAVLQYLQSITPNLALGGEVIHQREGRLNMHQSVTAPSLVGRYKFQDSTISGTLGVSGLHVCFHQKASQNLQVGVELEVNAKLQDSVATIAYQVDIPKAEFVFRGCVDSNWNVGAVLEKKLMPLPFCFTLSGMINHTKNQFRLGCGLIIG